MIKNDKLVREYLFNAYSQRNICRIWVRAMLITQGKSLKITKDWKRKVQQDEYDNDEKYKGVHVSFVDGVTIMDYRVQV
jgi:hypothetical protein